MDNDDRQIGRILKRREVLALMGGLGVAAVIGCESDGDGGATATEAATTTTTTSSEATATTTTSDAGSAATATATEATGTVAVPACVVIPERTEGPYFVDGQIERSDLVEDREGVPLNLSVSILEVSGDTCAPLAGAMVDVWHCDALGVYSGVTDAGFDTTGEQFLRGYQLTDASGVASFASIYPGWYSGRTVHIHFKVRTKGADGAAYDFTSQWFFDERISDAVFATDPYASEGQRDTTNASDNIFADDGEILTLSLTGDPASGYDASFAIGLDLSDSSVGASDSASANGGGGNRGLS
jgi:protocatechuate 3,4-dioxygenase beta subunit